MARKKKTPVFLPSTPGAVIDALLAELQQDEPDEQAVDSLRATLIQMGDAYVHPLVEKIRACADERESADLSFMVHVIGDPRLVEPLTSLAQDYDAPLGARITASVGLRVYGVDVKLDFPGLPVTPLPEMEEAIDQIADVLVQVHSSEGMESVVAGLRHFDAELRDALLTRLATRHGERMIPALTYLAQHPEPDVALSSVKALGHLESPLALRVLQRVVEQSSYPEVSHEARRALFQLCEKGMTAPADDADLPEWTNAATWTIERARLSNVDSVGSRMALLFCALPDGSAAWINTCLNDVVGIKDCIGMDGAREDVARDFDHLKKLLNNEVLLIDADPHYCHWLIEEARQKNKQSHFPLPVGYYHWITPLGAPPVRYEAPIIYQLIEVNKIKDAETLLEESDSLFDQRSFEGWILRFDDVRPFAEKAAVEARKLGGLPLSMMGVVPEEIIIEAVRALMTDETRQLLRRRLEELAYVFYQRNQKKVARQCVVVGRALTSDDPLDVPFAVEMVASSISAAMGALLGHYDLADLNASPWDPIV
jgi:hypothetical protein